MPNKSTTLRSVHNKQCPVTGDLKPARRQDTEVRINKTFSPSKQKVIQKNRVSGFDRADEFIKTQLLLYPEKPRIEIYRQVLEQFTEITLKKRTFYHYLNKINTGSLAFEKGHACYNKSKKSDNSETIIRTDSEINDIEVNVGAKIGAYRRIAGLKKNELAWNIGVHPSLITYYEQGKRRPSLKIIFRIAKVTDVPVDCFLTDREYPRGIADNINSVNISPKEIKTEFAEANKTSKVNADVVKNIKQLINEANKLMLSNPENCIEISKKAFRISKANNYSLGVGLAYLHIGEGFINQNKYSEALDKLLLAENILQKENHYEGLRSAYNNLGVIFFYWNDLENALGYYNKTLKLEKHFSDPKTKSEILNNIGSIYYKLKEYRKALQYMYASLNISEEHDLRSASSNYLSNIGYIYFILNEPAKAEYYLNRSITMCKKINNLSGLCHAYINLSRLKTKLGFFTEALLLLKKALPCAEQLKLHNIISRAYHQFADIYAQMGKVEKQKEYLQKCIKLAEPNNFRYLALLAYEPLAELYENNSDPANALLCYKKIQQLKDFLNDEKRTRAIEEIKTKMEVEQTEREKAILQHKNSELQQKNEQIIQQKEKLEKAEKELTELNRNLEMRVQEEIEKRRQQEQILIQKSKLEALGRMSAGMAHEINQPLGLIRLQTQNLIKNFQNDLISPRYLDEKSAAITDNIVRIKKIIEHVRIFSRNQKDTQVRFNVVKTAKDALSMISVQHHRIKIIEVIESACLETVGNSYRLEQVLLNLITNAKDATDSKTYRPGEDKQIILRLYSKQKSIYLEVEDNGCGIETDKLAHVFEPFFTTKEESKGTGLGLSVSFGIINDMKGKISIKSKKDRYTVIRIELPLIKESN